MVCYGIFWGDQLQSATDQRAPPPPYLELQVCTKQLLPIEKKRAQASKRQVLLFKD